jgi:hypothetical protein
VRESLRVAAIEPPGSRYSAHVSERRGGSFTDAADDGRTRF